MAITKKELRAARKEADRIISDVALKIIHSLRASQSYASVRNKPRKDHPYLRKLTGTKSYCVPEAWGQEGKQT